MMMKIILLALFVLLATDSTKGTCLSEDYSLFFPKTGTTDYVSIDGMPRLGAITACSWIRSKLQLSSKVALPLFSYATRQSHNEFNLFARDRYLMLLRQNEGARVFYDVNGKVTDGQWHHLCVTWEMSKGSVNIYIDGVLRGSRSGVKRGQQIPAGGLFVLGQEQDSVGGGFVASESFVGDLSGANVWNCVLTSKQISELSKSCLAGRGNVFNWAGIRGETMRGNVQVIEPSRCQA